MKAEKQPTHPTSWLDGVRGVAAFLVFIHHGGENFYRDSRSPWSSQNPHFLQLPVIRIIYDGATMVTIFFVVSGFALSYKPLLLADKDDFPTLSNALASATFRRAMRLCIPCAAIAFLSAMTSYFNLFHPDAKSKDPRSDTLMGTVGWWFNVLIFGFNPFRIDSGDLWNTPLLELEGVMWTIPFEYRGSLVVFAIILALGRTRRSFRLAALSCNLLYLIFVAQWDIFLFVSGILCCEIHHFLRSRPDMLPSDESREGKDKSLVQSVARICGLILGLLAILYVLSQPESWMDVGDAPFYTSLDAMTPSAWYGAPECGRFWRCLAAVALILIIDHTSVLRGWFRSRFPQYLGEISFSLYLIHGWLLNTIGRRIVALIYGWTAQFGSGTTREVCSMGLVLLIFTPILFWASDLLTRHLDRRTLDFARWAEEKCFRVYRAL